MMRARLRNISQREPEGARGRPTSPSGALGVLRRNQSSNWLMVIVSRHVHLPQMETLIEHLCSLTQRREGGAIRIDDDNERVGG
jgi:hypothetical protein